MSDKELFLTVVGGTKRVGALNCYLLHSEDVVVMIDCGLGLEKRGKENIKVYPPFAKYHNMLGQLDAIFISHGHLDHVGALHSLDTFLWEHGLSKPHAFMGQFTFEIADRHSQWERNKKLFFPHRLFQFGKEEKIKFSSCVVQTIPVLHSIPDAYSFLFTMNGKKIYYAGDFRFIAPDAHQVTAFQKRIERLGKKEHIDYACIECTNVFETEVDSEKKALTCIEEIITQTPGRIIFTTFSTHVDRYKFVADVARRQKRQMYSAGGNIAFMFDAMGISAKRASEEHVMDAHAIVCATGSQAESESALIRALYNSEKSEFALRPTDTVIISADPIPANGIEEDVCTMVSDLLGKVQAVYINEDAPDYFPKEAIRRKIHASGHGKRQDLIWMIDTLHPKTVIPIHGDRTKREALAEIARDRGLNSLLIEEGEIVSL
ncbi:MAG: ribonuclease J [bacterium]|nr:ribonuclease J [bacterium]